MVVGIGTILIIERYVYALNTLRIQSFNIAEGAVSSYIISRYQRSLSGLLTDDT